MPETQTPYRARSKGDRRPVDPIVLSEGDRIDRTATQVTMPGDAVHELLTAVRRLGLGHEYQARCGTVLFARAGAMRTTRQADCPACDPWADATEVVQP